MVCNSENFAKKTYDFYLPNILTDFVITTTLLIVSTNRATSEK